MGLLSNPELTQKISLLHKDNTDTYHLPGKTGNFNWKIKWFMPLHLGSFRNNMGCDLMQWNSSTLVSLFSWFGYTYIYIVLPPNQILQIFVICAQDFPLGGLCKLASTPHNRFKRFLIAKSIKKKDASEWHVQVLFEDHEAEVSIQCLPYQLYVQPWLGPH